MAKKEWKTKKKVVKFPLHSHTFTNSFLGAVFGVAAPYCKISIANAATTRYFNGTANSGGENELIAGSHGQTEEVKK